MDSTVTFNKSNKRSNNQRKDSGTNVNTDSYNDQYRKNSYYKESNPNNDWSYHTKKGNNSSNRQSHIKIVENSEGKYLNSHKYSYDNSNNDTTFDNNYTADNHSVNHSINLSESNSIYTNNANANANNTLNTNYTANSSNNYYNKPYGRNNNSSSYNNNVHNNFHNNYNNVNYYNNPYINHQNFPKINSQNSMNSINNSHSNNINNSFPQSNVNSMSNMFNINHPITSNFNINSSISPSNTTQNNVNTNITNNSNNNNSETINNTNTINIANNNTNPSPNHNNNNNPSQTNPNHNNNNKKINYQSNKNFYENYLSSLVGNLQGSSTSYRENEADNESFHHDQITESIANDNTNQLDSLSVNYHPVGNDKNNTSQNYYKNFLENSKSNHPIINTYNYLVNLRENSNPNKARINSNLGNVGNSCEYKECKKEDDGNSITNNNSNNGKNALKDEKSEFEVIDKLTKEEAKIVETNGNVNANNTYSSIVCNNNSTRKSNDNNTTSSFRKNYKISVISSDLPDKSVNTTTDKDKERNKPNKTNQTNQTSQINNKQSQTLQINSHNPHIPHNQQIQPINPLLPTPTQKTNNIHKPFTINNHNTNYPFNNNTIYPYNNNNQNDNTSTTNTALESQTQQSHHSHHSKSFHPTLPNTHPTYNRYTLLNLKQNYIKAKYPHIYALQQKHSSNFTKIEVKKNSTYFIIKSFNLDNIHKAIKYGVWSTTYAGNNQFDKAFSEAQSRNAEVYLFFSCNSSFSFQGIARLKSKFQSKCYTFWKGSDKYRNFNGSFLIEWIVIKDVPNSTLDLICINYIPFSKMRNGIEIPEEEALLAVRHIEVFYYCSSMVLMDFMRLDVEEKKWSEVKKKE